MRLSRPIAALAALLLLAEPAVAQDMSLYGASVPMEEEMKRSFRCDYKGPLYHSSNCTTPARSAPTRSGAAGGAKGSTVALSYSATPAIHQGVLADWLDRIRHNNPAGAQALAAEFARNNYDRSFRTVVAPFGLSGDDLGDALTAYLVLGWMIANGSGDPSTADVRDVRSWSGRRLAGVRQMADPKARAIEGESLKVQFMIMRIDWLAAQKNGTLRAFSDSVERRMQSEFRIDMRAVRLAGGFSPRR
jgi:hypothetical protein